VSEERLWHYCNPQPSADKTGANSMLFQIIFTNIHTFFNFPVVTGSTAVRPNHISITQLNDHQAFISATYTTTVSALTFTSSGNVPLIITQLPTQQYSLPEDSLQNPTNGPVTYTCILTSHSPLHYNPVNTCVNFPATSHANYNLPENSFASV
jgi:hypothetical protein